MSKPRKHTCYEASPPGGLMHVLLRLLKHLHTQKRTPIPPVGGQKDRTPWTEHCCKAESPPKQAGWLGVSGRRPSLWASTAEGGGNANLQFSSKVLCLLPKVPRRAATGEGPSRTDSGPEAPVKHRLGGEATLAHDSSPPSSNRHHSQQPGSSQG